MNFIKCKLALVLSLFILLFSFSSHVFAIDGPSAYNSVINQYVDAVAEKGEVKELNQAISTLRGTLSTTRWTLEDLNNDDIPELLISFIFPWGNQNSDLGVLYTIVNGTPKLVCNSAGQDNYRITQNKNIFKHGWCTNSSDPGDIGNEIYDLNTDGTLNFIEGRDLDSNTYYNKDGVSRPWKQEDYDNPNFFDISIDYPYSFDSYDPLNGPNPSQPSEQPDTPQSPEQSNPSQSPETSLSSDITPIYRLYHEGTGEHLYTPDENEYITLSSNGWNDEGIGWYAPNTGTPVYRLNNDQLLNHLYTTDENEVNVLTSQEGWTKDFDGKPMFYSGGDVPIYRLYNQELRGMHHLTMDQNEYSVLPNHGWKQEGIAIYGVSNEEDSLTSDGVHSDFINGVIQLTKQYDNQKDIDINDPFSSNRLIVKLKNGDLDLSKYDCLNQVKANDYYILQFDNKDTTEEAFNSLKNVSNIEYVIPDEYFQNPLHSESDLNNLVEVQASNNKVPEGHHSWGVDDICADGMAICLKNSQKRVVVAVIDSGIAKNSYNKSRLVKAGISDFVDWDDDPTDTFGHGTHVSGTIIDCTPDLNKIKILPIRVTKNEGTYISTSIVAAGIYHAADNGANVINMSLGLDFTNSFGGHEVIHDAINYANKKGITTVVSSGNDGRDIDSFSTCPAHLNNVITVGSVDENHERSVFAIGASNYGKTLDVVAPGTNIVSCATDGSFNKETCVRSGTSMAAPHVTAAVAMLKMQDMSRSPSEIKKLICDNAKDLGESGWDKYYGNGLINLSDLAKVPVPDTGVGSQRLVIRPWSDSGLGFWPDVYKVTFKADGSNKTEELGEVYEQLIDDEYGLIIENARAGTYHFEGYNREMPEDKYKGDVTVTKSDLTGSGDIKKDLFIGMPVRD